MSTALAEVSLHDRDALLASLTPRLAAQPFWLRRVEHCLTDTASIRLHLAVFREPFLTLLFDGKKTVESRFSRNRIAPYGCIARDDVILLKRNAGPVAGIALAGDPGFYEMGAAAWRDIRARFAAAICAPGEDFWTERAQARYATLIPVRAAMPFAGFSVVKRDRRAWLVIDPPQPAQITTDTVLEA
jgi:hypothetical protein